MIKNELVSLIESKSPLDHPILTPLVSLISLCASYKACLIHSMVTLILSDIYHVSIMKFSVSTSPKSGGITGKSHPKHASVHGK